MPTNWTQHEVNYLRRHAPAGDIQNNYPEAPDKPTPCLPGSNGKISKMQQRVAAGRSVFDNGDEEPDES